MTTSLTDLPTLYKRTGKGETQQWHIRVEPADDGETAHIVTTHGLVGGKQQESTDHITEGKNAGRKNATTAVEQAIAEAVAKHTKQQDRNHYGLTVEESDMKILAAPMLAHVYEKHAKKVDWGDPVHLQPKFDGHRCLAMRSDDGKITLVSRKGVQITSCPHIIETLAPEMRCGTVLDGELYVHGMAVTSIGSLIKKFQADSAKLRFMIYDVADQDLAFRQRYSLLQRLDFEDETCQVSPTEEVRSEDEAVERQAQFIDDGYEGAMLRHGSAGYRSGKRSHELLKMKSFTDAEFPIVGVKEGRGTFAGMAILECTTPAGHKFEVTAPGTHAEKSAAWQNRKRLVGQSVTVKYPQMTETEKPVPFHPVAVAIKEEEL